MQVLKKVDWKMFVARSFWRCVPVGLTAGVWCFVAGMALHSCAKEPEPVAKELTKVKVWEEQYESMSVEEKMKGIVYE